LSRRIAVVQLRRVRPSWKVGVAAVCQYRVNLRALDSQVVLRLPLQVGFGSPDVVFRMLLHPWMVESSVIGDEIQHQTQAVFVKAFSQTEKCRVTPQQRIGYVTGYRETRTTDVFIAKVCQRFLKLSPPFGY